MKSRLFAGVVSLACFFVLGTSAVQASVFYKYSGNNFAEAFGIYDTSMSVTAIIELAAPLDSNLNIHEYTPLSFRLSDGVNTITDDIDSGSFTGWFSTDTSGSITEWYLGATMGGISVPVSVGDESLGVWSRKDIGNLMIDDGASYYQCTSITSFDTCDYLETLGEAWVYNTPGNWEVVPIPPAVWLFGSGLIGLIGIARRRKQS